MKNQFLMILLIFIGSVLCTSVAAQSISVTAIENAVKKDGKYAMLVSNARYFQAAVRTGVGLKANNQDMDFEVVLIGPVVKDLATDEGLKSTIEAGKKAGIRIVVCEAAMNYFKLKHKDFHRSIAFTPDGFIYMFGLQESGFKTITL
ncbi:DsrE family protein [Bizionia gelidisalsuginis]|uniref:DsrE family protein n=2 Tax=Bizionia TaxID=283785 RepID=A0A8H2LFB3_9FLAO|nr:MULTISPECIES: DsrE family protein [Bizionia]TYB71530.1 DsrE family protein [Bizionia saleffrena]TYC10749.1 DsrE family protein [Bizionia gelidisalsuginis]